jgi:hypothetical protein
MLRSWTRRRFTQTLVGGGGFASPLLAAAADPEPTKPSAVGDPTPASDPAAPPAAPPLEDLLLLAVLRKYPLPELTDERLLGIRNGIANQLRQGAVLRAGLQNSDEPATVFRAWTSRQP